MPNPENITPPKKGEIRNPKGKPKGTLNRSTIVKKWLLSKQDFENPIDGKMVKMTQADIITLALIQKARTGDVYAFRELMDSTFGKIKEQISIEEDTEKHSKGITVTIKRTP